MNKAVCVIFRSTTFNGNIICSAGYNSVINRTLTVEVYILNCSICLEGHLAGVSLACTVNCNCLVNSNIFGDVCQEGDGVTCSCIFECFCKGFVTLCADLSNGGSSNCYIFGSKTILIQLNACRKFKRFFGVFQQSNGITLLCVFSNSLNRSTVSQTDRSNCGSSFVAVLITNGSNRITPSGKVQVSYCFTAKGNCLKLVIVIGESAVVTAVVACGKIEVIHLIGTANTKDISR